MHGAARQQQRYGAIAQELQGIRGFRILQRLIEQNSRRRRMHSIVLLYEGRQDFHGLTVTGIVGKLRFVTQMPPTAHHRQIDAGLAPLPDHHDHDIDILVATAGDVLLVLHLAQGLYLVTQQRSLLEGQFRRGTIHRFGEMADQLLLSAQQKETCHADILRIGFGVNQPDARPGTAFDLVQQARSRAVVEHRVLTGTQAKHLLQQVDTFADGSRRRKRAVIVGPAVGLATKKAQTGKFIPPKGDVGIGLVVAKQDVVTGREGFDQVVFEQQRFGLGTGRRCFHPGNLADHQSNARAGQIAAKIRTHPFLEIFCLADVKHLALSVEHAINPRQSAQRSEQGFCIKSRGRVFIHGNGKLWKVENDVITQA